MTDRSNFMKQLPVEGIDEFEDKVLKEIKNISSTIKRRNGRRKKYGSI